MADDLTAGEMAAWRPFVTAATMVISALDADMKANFGISHFDHGLLVMLLGQPRRRARMTDIARAMRVDPANVTYRVRRLERLELLERIPEPNDGRVTYARLTPAGIRLLRDAWPMHRDGIRRYFLAHVRPEHLAVIAEVFALVVEASMRELERPAPA